jgi:hypothetical protein
LIYLILPYKSIAKRSSHLQSRKLYSPIKSMFIIQSYGVVVRIYSGDSLLGAMEGEFDAIKQL